MPLSIRYLQLRSPFRPSAASNVTSFPPLQSDIQSFSLIPDRLSFCAFRYDQMGEAGLGGGGMGGMGGMDPQDLFSQLFGGGGGGGVRLASPVCTLAV
jgi:hypothetical protein